MNSFVEVWRRITSLTGTEFHQVRGQMFTYIVSGEYIIPSTTQIRISNTNFKKAWEQLPVNGPGALQDIIAPSYVFAILTDPRIASSG
jgi:hypothetical protein